LQSGFRTIALVTIDESDEDAMFQASHNHSEGSGSHGMYFRVNGALMLARGANFIPMDQLEGRLSEEAHRIAVRSAAAANMNMMRVWGGGMVLPDSFYEACDEEGILLYHDMMFVDEAGHRPVETQSVESEIRHLIRSLSSHPSIAVWNGCNECQVVMGTPSEIYATFVMQIVAQEDDTRSIWPSSPSKHGWKTGVYSLDSRPNGRSLSTWGPDDFRRDLETHGPYMRSFSEEFPGVNGMNIGCK
jgi:beta-mannosidase